MKNRKQYNEYLRNWRNKNKDRINKLVNEKNRYNKIEVLKHYSSDENPICAVCGEGRLDCLSIDHINGGGRQHLKSIGRRGSNFYDWLISHKFPIGYRVLCMNCQFIEYRKRRIT